MVQVIVVVSPKINKPICLGTWIDAYPIASIEDPLSEHDTDAMIEFTNHYGGCVQITGDDYLVTSAGLVNQAVDEGACNTALIKINQKGTGTEAVNAFNAAREANSGTVVFARTGETEDSSISHLSVGLGSGQLKVSSFQRSERMVKWNSSAAGRQSTETHKKRTQEGCD